MIRLPDRFALPDSEIRSRNTFGPSTPLGATLLFVMYGAIVLGWYEGHIAWWLALGTAGAASRTLGAIKKVRRYKSWLADWQAMSDQMQPAQPARPEKRRGGRGRWGIITAAVLFFVLPLCVGAISNDKALAYALTWLWLGDCLFLVFALLQGILRRSARIKRRSPESRKVETEDASVAWLVGRPSSSPSRLDATRWGGVKAISQGRITAPLPAL